MHWATLSSVGQAKSVPCSWIEVAPSLPHWLLSGVDRIQFYCPWWGKTAQMTRQSYILRGNHAILVVSPQAHSLSGLHHLVRESGSTTNSQLQTVSCYRDHWRTFTTHSQNLSPYSCQFCWSYGGQDVLSKNKGITLRCWMVPFEGHISQPTKVTHTFCWHPLTHSFQCMTCRHKLASTRVSLLKDRSWSNWHKSRQGQNSFCEAGTFEKLLFAD